MSGTTIRNVGSKQRKEALDFVAFMFNVPNVNLAITL